MLRCREEKSILSVRVLMTVIQDDAIWLPVRNWSATLLAEDEARLSDTKTLSVGNIKNHADQRQPVFEGFPRNFLWCVTVASAPDSSEQR